MAPPHGRSAEAEYRAALAEYNRITDAAVSGPGFTPHLAQHADAARKRMERAAAKLEREQKVT